MFCFHERLHFMFPEMKKHRHPSLTVTKIRSLLNQFTILNTQQSSPQQRVTTCHGLTGWRVFCYSNFEFLSFLSGSRR